MPGVVPSDRCLRFDSISDLSKNSLKISHLVRGGLISSRTGTEGRPGVHTPSKARISFDDNLKDVKALLALHKQQGGDARGRRYRLEVLSKSAIGLITSYWEAYCEDLAAEGLECIVTHTKTSDALPKEIRKIIAKEPKGENNELAIWKISDDKWRDALRGRLQTLQEAINRNLNNSKCETSTSYLNPPLACQMSP